MLELSDIQSSQEELEDYYAKLQAQHVTPAWIGGGISIGQAQNPAFDLLGADELGGPHRLRPQIAPSPPVRHRLAPRLGRSPGFQSASGVIARDEDYAAGQYQL